MKVIQLIDSLTPGGAEMMAVNISNALAEEGITSYICATRSEGDLKKKISSSTRYLFLGKKSIVDFKAIYTLNKFLSHHQINIIHAHSSSYFMGFVMKLLNPKLQLIWHDHYGLSEELAKRSTFPLSWFSRFFTASIAVNSLLLKWHQKYLVVGNQSFIQNFANFNPSEKVTTFLKGEQGKRIVCMANLRPQKDHLNLLKSFAIKNTSHQEWTLHLVGKDFLDGYSEEIKMFIKIHRLENHVFLYGSCLDTAHILSQTTIAVLASSSEGLPVSLLEYGLKKLPVVVTNVGDCGSVITNNKNGLVVPKENEEALAKAINELITNATKRDEFGVELYHHVKKHYSKEAYIKQLMKIYTNAN
ncbi:glycosyltransferase [Lutibacter holmesii]|uniref:glycosyltransferase n=1 Tax=Lutibacter holmesii TaxID=1137985 RepID=UPI0036DB0D2E